jgi:hypothetical protein
MRCGLATFREINFTIPVPRFTVIFADRALGSGLQLDVMLFEKDATSRIGHIGLPKSASFL